MTSSNVRNSTLHERVPGPDGAPGGAYDETRERFHTEICMFESRGALSRHQALQAFVCFEFSRLIGRYLSVVFYDIFSGINVHNQDIVPLGLI
ncbi:hypothetical protein GWI33_013917 [Rhynchophorus ferrugineus]|uniref:Uncharacterized protein n=1 Tax=Rhynchophorus ferrugineus TaxID=354439 RepID=A0A834I2R9_RHYFE|nr:hypothetical protein GWI33_013917 [Rhynchophorus ferrugineus]